MMNIPLTRFSIFRNALILLVSSFYWSLQLMLLDKQRYDVFNGNPLTNWNVSEWLIGYQGGFVRRGLFGSLLLRFAGQGIDPYFVVTFLPTAAYLFLSALWFSIILSAVVRKGISSYYLFISLLNPSALFFFVMGGNVYRKDVVFIALLVLSSFNLFCLTREKISSKKALLLTLSFFALAVLVLGLHEGLFAFVAVPVWFSICLFWGRDFSAFLRFLPVTAVFVGGSFLLSIFFVFSIVFKGDQVAVAEICSAWSNYFPYDCATAGLHGLGAVSPLMWDIKRQLSLSGLRVMFSSLAPLTVLFSLLYLSCSVALSGVLFGKKCLDSYIAFLCVLALPVGTLFLIGCDWGRYLAVVNTSLLFVCATLSPSAQIGVPTPFRASFRKVYGLVEVFSLGLSTAALSFNGSRISRQSLVIVFFVFTFTGLNYISYASFDDLIDGSVWANFTGRAAWLLQVYFSQPVSPL